MRLGVESALPGITPQLLAAACRGLEPTDFTTLVQVGVNASAESVLDQLIASDTAMAFNISEGDVNVTSIVQVSLRALCTSPACAPGSSSVRGCQTVQGASGLGLAWGLHGQHSREGASAARTARQCRAGALAKGLHQGSHPRCCC